MNNVDVNAGPEAASRAEPVDMKLEVVVLGVSDDVAALAELLRETEEHHGRYEKTHAEHHWWDWYAAYLSARQSGGSPEEATAAADRYMADVHHVPPK